MSWPALLSPVAIGGLALRNRVVLPGMDMNHCVEGVISRAEIDHYAARAGGGCALIITGAAAIAWPDGATSRKQPALSDDRFVPGIRALADAVHAHGAALCVQLVHHGKVAGVDTADGRAQLVPSVPHERLDMRALVDCPVDELMGLASATGGKPATYHEADHDDIRWVIERFADAADRVKRAGADAVEVHGAHGYLISTFLSRAYNHRDDDYGGSLENRSRLLVEVIGAIRDRVGAGYPIVVRLNGCEYGADDGITPEETAATARLAELAGADAIHVSATAANPFRDFTNGPLPAGVGQYRAMTATVKEAVGIPVIAVGRLLPEVAEAMIAGGDCDLVAMGRQQLADPQLVNKLAAGRTASIRPCINCYVCVEQNFFDASPLCAVNPALGDEPAAAAQVSLAALGRRIVVVGGGPAGLETARIAAQRGHRVTVLESAASLGGATWFAAMTGSDNQRLVDWLVHEVTELGVEIRLSTHATVDSVRSLAPDAVVIATGASGDAARATREFVESMSERPAGRVTVVGGNLIGLSLARYVAAARQPVSVVERDPHLGTAMAMPRRWAEVRAATDDGIELIRSASAEQIDSAVHEATQVIVTDVWERDSHLADGLSAAGLAVHVVGDAIGDDLDDGTGLGYLAGAMHTAHRVATNL